MLGRSNQHPSHNHDRAGGCHPHLSHRWYRLHYQKEETATNRPNGHTEGSISGYKPVKIVDRKVLPAHPCQQSYGLEVG